MFLFGLKGFKEAAIDLSTSGQFLIGGNIISPTPRSGLSLSRKVKSLITKVKKDQLLAILVKDRDDHREVFEEAFANYKVAVVKELEEALEDARAGTKIWRATKLTQPVNQIADYNRVIRMLELTTEEIIELDENQFSQYVLNKWHWASRFAASNSSYATSGKSAAYFASLEGESTE